MHLWYQRRAVFVPQGQSCNGPCWQIFQSRSAALLAAWCAHLSCCPKDGNRWIGLSPKTHQRFFRDVFVVSPNKTEKLLDYLICHHHRCSWIALMISGATDDGKPAEHDGKLGQIWRVEQIRMAVCQNFGMSFFLIHPVFVQWAFIRMTPSMNQAGWILQLGGIPMLCKWRSPAKAKHMATNGPYLATSATNIMNSWLDIGIFTIYPGKVQRKMGCTSCLENRPFS